MRRILRAPLLHFLVLGIALHAVEPAWRERFGPRPVLVVTAAQQAALRETFEEQFDRSPSAGEMAALVERAIEEEILFRNAIELGFDRNNPFVDYRLATLAHFLGAEGNGGESSGGDVPGDRDLVDGALVAEARALGLDRTDLVVRRQLVETLRLVYQRPAPGEPPPGDEEIEATYRREADRFRRPERIAFAHVYFSRDRRGEALEDDARRALATIRDGGLDFPHARRLGDPFLLGAEIPPTTPADLESRYGRELARRIVAAPAGEWTGPVPSAWGLHLVFVRERIPGGVPPLAEVRDKVLAVLRAERAEERLRRRIGELRSRYEIRVEEPAP